MGKHHRIKFIGMDVHQKSISIALADDGPEGEVRLYGPIKNTPGRSLTVKRFEEFETIRNIC